MLIVDLLRPRGDSEAWPIARQQKKLEQILKDGEKGQNQETMLHS